MNRKFIIFLLLSFICSTIECRAAETTTITDEETTTVVPTESPPTTETPTEVPTELPPTTETPTELPTELPPTTETPTELPPSPEQPTELPPTTETPTELPPTTEQPTELPSTTEDPTTTPGDGCDASTEKLNITEIEGTNVGPYYVNSTCVKYLQISNNGIQTISDQAFAGLPNLISLNLTHNNLTSFFGFGAHEKLQELYLGDSLNTVSDIILNYSDISGKFPKLRIISFRNTRLSGIIKDGPIDLPNLQELDLSNTTLTSVSIPETVTTLHLDDAAELDSATFATEFENLTFLSLDNNRHFKILDDPDSSDCDTRFLCLNLKKLRYLSLADSSVKAITLSAFDNLKQLTLMNLRGSNLLSISDLNLRSMAQLTFLDISETSFSNLHFKLLPNLQNLFMNNMKTKEEVIEVLNAGLDLPKLSSLSIGGNGLSEVPESALENLTQLKVLYLAKNHIKKLSFPVETSLSELNVNDNLISDFDDISFDKTKELTSLYIVHNPVKYLYRKSLDNLPENFMVHFGDGQQEDGIV